MYVPPSGLAGLVPSTFPQVPGDPLNPLNPKNSANIAALVKPLPTDSREVAGLKGEFQAENRILVGAQEEHISIPPLVALIASKERAVLKALKAVAASSGTPTPGTQTPGTQSTGSGDGSGNTGGNGNGDNSGNNNGNNNGNNSSGDNSGGNSTNN